MDDDLCEFLDGPAPVSYLPDFDGVDTNGWPRFDWSRAPEIYTTIIHEDEKHRRQVIFGKDLEWINKVDSGGFFFANYIKMFKEVERKFYEFSPDIGHKIQQSYASYMNNALYDGVFIALYESAEGYKIIYPFGREPHEHCDSGIEFRPWMLEAGQGKNWHRDCCKTWFLMAGDLPSGLLNQTTSSIVPELSRSLPNVQRVGGGPLSKGERDNERAATLALQSAYASRAGMKGMKPDAIDWIINQFGLSKRAAGRAWDGAEIPEWRTPGKPKGKNRFNFKGIN